VERECATIGDVVESEVVVVVTEDVIDERLYGGPGSRSLPLFFFGI